MDAAGDGTGGTTISRSATLMVSGWAVDSYAGAPVTSVSVYVDGVSVGTGTLGVARTDVAAAYSRPDYTNSGWTFSMSASGLSPGQHVVTATAMGPSGTAPLGSKTITITAVGSGG